MTKDLISEKSLLVVSLLKLGLDHPALKWWNDLTIKDIHEVGGIQKALRQIKIPDTNFTILIAWTWWN